MNSRLKKLKDYLFKNPWIFWLFVLLIIVSFSYNLKTGIIMTAIFCEGMLVGYIVPFFILYLQKRTSLKSILIPLVVFIIIAISIYMYVDNKAILLLIIPLAIPNLAAGLMSLRK